ncbi:MAG: hypothetical protein U9O86_08310 [Campylobacterota bacterium]|nr:hypothetical protein [Campylobacterota bacterium]
MRIKKLEKILNSGSFHSELSDEVELALQTVLKKTVTSRVKKSTKPMLDFDEINLEAIKLAGTGVKYPESLPKGVIISIKQSLAST